MVGRLGARNLGLRLESCAFEVVLVNSRNEPVFVLSDFPPAVASRFRPVHVAAYTPTQTGYLGSTTVQASAAVDTASAFVLT